MISFIYKENNRGPRTVPCGTPDKTGAHPIKKRNDSGLAESDTEQAEQFNGQFTDVFSKTSESEVPLLEKSAPPMSDNYVSNE